MFRFQLRRISNNKKIIEEVDGLRFIAISLVFLIHLKWIWLIKSGHQYNLTEYDKILSNAIQVGNYGVELFFVISGFILALPWIKSISENKPKPSLKTFYLRRLTRLEPPYIISMLLFFFLLVIKGGYTYQELTPHLLASLAYVHNFIYNTGSIINKAAWSLEIEIQFYLLAPLIIPLIYKLCKKTSLTTVIGLTIIYPWLIFSFISYSQTGLHNFLHYFLSGIIWAIVYTKYNLPGFKKHIAFDVGVIAAALLSYATIQYLSYKSQLIIMPILINFIFGGCFCGKYFNQLLRVKFISIIGGMCYTIYLFHGRLISIPVMLFFKNLINTGSFTLDLILLIATITPLALLASTVLYLILERPFMDKNWPQKFQHFISRKLLLTKKYHN